jgi:chromosome segregation ATPase
MTLPLNLAVSAAIALTALFGYQTYRVSDLKQQVAASERKAAGLEAHLAETLKQQKVKDEALQESNKRATANAAASDAARTELERLRRTIAANRNRQPDSAASVKHIDALSTVLADCAAEYEKVGQRADGHLNDALTLHQAWPR